MRADTVGLYRIHEIKKRGETLISPLNPSLKPLIKFNMIKHDL